MKERKKTADKNFIYSGNILERQGLNDIFRKMKAERVCHYKK